MSSSESSFYVTGGTLRHDAPCYVERQADRDLSEGLLAGEFCYVLTPRQMGKSSLMVRTASKLRQQGVNVIALDLTAIGQNLTPEQWYDGLVVRMGRQLQLDEELDQFWREHARLGPCQRWFAAIRDTVLRHRPGPLVLFVDEIDTVRSLPFSTDEFFAAIRECYNRRAEDREWNRVTFCLLGVATPSDIIRDTRTTPFNIGRRIELHDFSEAEAAPLAQGLQPPSLREEAPRSRPAGDEPPTTIRDAERLLHRILFWTGGHPYLTQRFCQAVAGTTRSANPAEVDRLCQELFLSPRARERDDNLLFVRERLLRSEVDRQGLLELYGKVRRDRRVADEDTSLLVGVLRLSGIVRAEGGRLRNRNRVYTAVFDEAWIQAHLPDAELRRQRAAFRRGVIRTTAIAAVAIAVLTIAVLIAVDRATRSRRALAQSYVSQAKTERTSGRAGQRVASLRALEQARPYHANELELRNDTIASLALVDLEKGSVPASLPPGTTAVALDPTLTHHALGDAQGAIRLVETGSHRLAAEFPAVGTPVTWLSVSSNGRFVAAQYGSANPPRLAVWEASSRTTVLNLTNQVLPSALDFSRDSSTVAVGLPEGLVRIFTLPAGKDSIALHLRMLVNEIREPVCLRFDPTGSRLAEAGRSSQVVQIWGLTGDSTNSLFHSSPIVAMAWSPDGHHLATASENRDIYLWDLRFSDKKQVLVQAHSGAVVDLAFNSHGDLLASLGADMALKLWATATGRQMTQPLGSEPSGRLFFDRDGRRLGCAGVESGVQVWNILGPDHYRVFRALGALNAPFTSLCFSPEGRVVVAANDLGLFLGDGATGRELSFLIVRSPTHALVHPVRGDLLASTPFGFYRWRRQVMQDGSFRFGPSECLDLPSRLGRCAWGPAAAQAAVVHEDHIHLVGTEGPFAATRLPFKGPFDELTTSPDGKWMVTWSADPKRSIEIWDLTSRAADAPPVQVIPGWRHVAFSADGRYLVTCLARQYQLWETGTWRNQKLALTSSSTGDSHGLVAFARAGRHGDTLLALSDSPTTIKLFRVTDGWPAGLLELATLASPDSKTLLALAFNSDGSRLAASAGPADPTVQVWNLANIREALVRMGLQGDLPAFAASPERPVTIVFAPDELDRDKPQKWQEVEALTAALASALDPKAGTVVQHLMRRGKCFLDLRRPLEARRDFEKALALRPEDADIQEWLRKAAVPTEQTTPELGAGPGGSGQAGKD